MSKHDTRRTARILVAETLEAFRRDIQSAGPGKPLPPLMRIVVGDSTVVQPIDVGREMTTLVTVTLQIVLQKLGATAYALAMQVGAAPGTSIEGIHACGGVAGWDTAIGEQFVFDGGVLNVLGTVAGDSDQSRPLALEAVPNLLRKPDLSPFTPAQKQALDDFAMAYVRSIRARLNPIRPRLSH